MKETINFKFSYRVKITYDFILKYRNTLLFNIPVINLKLIIL